VGLPLATAYGASKAALIHMASSLRFESEKTGILVQVINPGFVKTPLTDANKFSMPFLLSAEDAAARICRGLRGTRFEIAFPWQLVLPLKIARLLPWRLFFAAAARAAADAAAFAAYAAAANAAYAAEAAAYAAAYAADAAADPNTEWTHALALLDRALAEACE
uniref:SDR family NAD(P)-dependent oxidoreductase n=1 Tax=Metallibacterium scheffleri TaxID=993689 RepID=UPI0023F1023C